MIGYYKKIEKIIRESAFDKKKRNPGLKFNPELALTRLSNNWALISNQFLLVSASWTVKEWVWRMCMLISPHLQVVFPQQAKLVL